MSIRSFSGGEYEEYLRETSFKHGYDLGWAEAEHALFKLLKDKLSGEEWKAVLKAAGIDIE